MRRKEGGRAMERGGGEQTEGRKTIGRVTGEKRQGKKDDWENLAAGW